MFGLKGKGKEESGGNRPSVKGRLRRHKIRQCTENKNIEMTYHFFTKSGLRMFTQWKLSFSAKVPRLATEENEENTDISLHECGPYMTCIARRSWLRRGCRSSRAFPNSQLGQHT